MEKIKLNLARSNNAQVLTRGHLRNDQDKTGWLTFIKPNSIKRNNFIGSQKDVMEKLLISSDIPMTIFYNNRRQRIDQFIG